MPLEQDHTPICKYQVNEFDLAVVETSMPRGLSTDGLYCNNRMDPITATFQYVFDSARDLSSSYGPWCSGMAPTDLGRKSGKLCFHRSSGMELNLVRRHLQGCTRKLLLKVCSLADISFFLCKTMRVLHSRMPACNSESFDLQRLRYGNAPRTGPHTNIQVSGQ